MWRDDSLIFDMLHAARQIREYTAGLHESEFLKNRRDQDAVLLQFTVLGESAKKVSADAEADTLYINFKKPSHATDSEMTDDDVIVRYEGDAIIGFTVLHASKRMKHIARGRGG